MASLVWVCRTCRQLFRTEPNHICPYCGDAYSVDPHALIPLTETMPDPKEPTYD